MARISVAMAACNGERYLPEQLDSILKQLLPEDEIVVSCDPSTDGTMQVLEEYCRRDSRVRVVPGPGKGIAGNFNNAIAHCTGNYIFISDQDDRWADNKRQRVVQAFGETGADMVIHNGVHTDEAMEPVSQPFFQMYRIGDGKLRNLLKPRYSGCCMAFTRELAKTILPIPENMDAYDHWLGTVGEWAGKITYVEDVLLYHRLHGENVTPKRSRSLGTILKARGKLLLARGKRLHRKEGA